MKGEQLFVCVFCFADELKSVLAPDEVGFHPQ